ncbi:MAG: glycoside hydrolase family 3 C-terminal domain-containing protein [Arachnia sp.]
MADAWLDPALPLAERAAAVAADLSRDELEAVARGDFAALTARGIPEPAYVDSGTGLRGVDGATAFPNGIALAASFDESLAEEYGRAVGEEARAGGFTVVLGPTVDLARDPLGGRVGEAFGEDPFLAGRIGAAHVTGLQGAHVVAQVKHYVAYNGEHLRTGEGPDGARGDAIDVLVDDAALHEAYLRPFEAVVAAGAWSMMGSYNRLRGRYVCESEDLLSLPRRRWGWQGFWCPDFLFAVRSPEAALAAGLDLGALGGDGGRTPAMVAARPDEALREIAQHLASAMIGSGLVDDPLPEPSAPSTAAHRTLARRAAVAGSVLLRNDGVLPLAVSSVALIGPAGDDALFVGGGAASVSLDPDRLVTPRAAIEARAAAAGVSVRVAQGSLGDRPLPPIPAEAFLLPDGSGPGVLVEFTDGTRTWTEVLDRIDHSVSLPDPDVRWPRRWRTRLVAERTGTHRLSLAVGGRAIVTIDGAPVLSGEREAEQFLHGPHYPVQAVVHLEAGRAVDLAIDLDRGPSIVIPPMGLGPCLRLGWQPPDGMLDEAAQAAADAEAAVVFVNAAAGEGMDRDGLALPGDQDALVSRVATANPRTVVVVNAPGPVLMPWLDDVAAVLHVWYPGEEFGPAVAEMLFGDVEPGGRLPLTFPRALTDLPGRHAQPATTLDYRADDGLGYRARGVREAGALFPFGFGLGYGRTTAEVAFDDGAGTLTVTVRATNTGTRPTVHVAQVYAEAHGSAPRELVGVVRVPVDVGETAIGTLTVGPDDIKRWDPVSQQRVPLPGRHRIVVADHAEAEGPGADLVVG